MFKLRTQNYERGGHYAKARKGSGTGEEKEAEQGKKEASGQRAFGAARWQRKRK